MLLLAMFRPVFAQNPMQKKLDSLETVLASTSKTDTVNILKTGTYILNYSTSDRQKFEVLQKIAESYFRVNNLNQSVAYAFKAKAIAEKTGDPEMMAQAYGSIANQYSYLNLTDKARPYLNKAMSQIDKLPAGDNKHRLKALSYLELGNLDFNIKNYTAANTNYKKSLQQFGLMKNIGPKNRYNYRRSFYNIGNSYYYLNQPDSAENYLQKALKIEDAESPSLKYFIYSTLAEVYTARGSYRRAIDTLQTILKDPEFDIISLKMEIYLNLSRNYQRIGDKTNYTLYNERHLALRDTVEGHALKAIDTAFNAEQKDFSESISESRQYNRWLLYGILAVVAASGSIIFFLNRKKKKEHALYLSIIDKLQRQKEISVESEMATEPESKMHHSIPSVVEAEILAGLQRFETEEKFRNPKLTLPMMAVALNTNPAYLSAVIKAHKDKNFNNYINELRIRYICNKIHTHREYVNYKISYLAEDCGFTSHSTFSTIFKKVTGIPPSVFLGEEEKRHSEKIAS